MGFKEFLSNVGGKASKHAPLLLMILGTAAEVGAVILAAKGEHDAQEIISNLPDEKREDPKQVRKAVTKCFVPSTILLALGVGCNGASWFINNKRVQSAELNAATYASAYAVASTTADALRAEAARIVPDKVEEIESAVKDKVNPVPVISETQPSVSYIPSVKGEDDILCKCVNTGHYLWSNANKIGRAENTVDAWLASGTERVSYADYFLELTKGAVDVGTDGEEKGWTDSMSVQPGKYLDIGFGSELLAGKPVLTFEFRNKPVQLDIE